MEVLQKKIKGCDDSFFYDGLIAKNGDYEMIACGDIRIYQNNKDGDHIGMYDGKARDGFDLDIETDKDLAKIDNELDSKYVWENNNWFQIEPDGEVYHSYSEAIKTLKELTTD
jgi:hypothetical protein